MFLKQLRTVNVARDKEWRNDAKPFTLVFWANELAGETGEACNILKKFDREFVYRVKGSRSNIDALADELADIIICCDLTGIAAGVEYDETCWPTVPIKSEHDYSLYGAMMASLAGRACGIAVNYSTHINKNQLETVLCGLVKFTKATADTLGINLQERVRTKFNLTSYKLGLQTVMKAED
jgi:NTP pyrophosphatase (non-canonical NTP hydrolase)